MRQEVAGSTVVDVLEQGIADGTHIGAQLYVSRGGAVIADVAVGRRSGRDCRRATRARECPASRRITRRRE
jgi:hypothetical protein